MAYSSVQEVVEMLKDDMLNIIIGNAYIENEQERRDKLAPLAEKAIQDADAEIDGFLMKRYPVPINPVPMVLNKYSKDIAVYNLVSRAGIDSGDRESNYLTRYKNAISFLSQVAKGIVDISVESRSKSNVARSSFKVKSSR